MSHFTQLKTRIKNLQMLKKALQELDISFTEAEQGQKLSVKGWEKHTLEADMEIDSGCSYGIAVNLVGDEIKLEADWWAIETFTGRTQDSILKEIEKKYAYETIMDKIKAQGYSVVNEEESTEQLRIVVRRWV